MFWLYSLHSSEITHYLRIWTNFCCLYRWKHSTLSVAVQWELPRLVLQSLHCSRASPLYTRSAPCLEGLYSRPNCWLSFSTSSWKPNQEKTRLQRYSDCSPRVWCHRCRPCNSWRSWKTWCLHCWGSFARTLLHPNWTWLSPPQWWSHSSTRLHPICLARCWLRLFQLWRYYWGTRCRCHRYLRGHRLSR